MPVSLPLLCGLSLFSVQFWHRCILTKQPPFKCPCGLCFFTPINNPPFSTELVLSIHRQLMQLVSLRKERNHGNFYVANSALLMNLQYLKHSTLENTSEALKPP